MFKGFRIGLMESALVAGAAVVGGFVAWEWGRDSSLALVGGLAFAVTATVAYAMYRMDQHRAQEPRSAPRAMASDVLPLAMAPPEPSSVASDGSIAFRVIGSRGVYPRGHRVGEVMWVTPSGGVSPAVCVAAESVFRMAAAASGDGADHALVLPGARSPAGVPARAFACDAGSLGPARRSGRWPQLHRWLGSKPCAVLRQAIA